MYRDRDLIISPHPTRNPHSYFMVDYNRFLRRAFSLPHDASTMLGKETSAKPKMLIIEPKGMRKLLNLWGGVRAVQGARLRGDHGRGRR
jgi:hypothetical protein